MADESRRRYLFVAIDRATRWVFIRVFAPRPPPMPGGLGRDLERTCPMRIRTVLTDNGKEFTTASSACATRAATGEHEFDTLCAALGHRAPPDPAEVTAERAVVRHWSESCQRPSVRAPLATASGIRTLQRPHRGGAAIAPLPLGRGTGDHAATIRLALQPATPAISPRQQVALAGAEGLAQTQTRTVQEKAMLPAGM